MQRPLWSQSLKMPAVCRISSLMSRSRARLQGCAFLQGWHRPAWKNLTDVDFELSEKNIRKAYGKKIDSLLQFLRELFDLEAIPDYQEIVRRQFIEYGNRNQFTANQLRFLRAVESVFLQKRHLQLPD